MAKKRKRDRKWRGSCTRGFQDSDLEWLAEQFQRQSGLNPDLTVEEFAIRHGIQPDMINRLITGAQNTYSGRFPKTYRRNKKWANSRKHFACSDFAWLAKQFQKQAKSNPGLTLEAFAVRHGVKPEWISRSIDSGEKAVTLWHGTTEDRARAIVEQGFRAQRPARGVWFTKMLKFACSVAGARAQSRRRMPMVIRCEIDLEQYPEYGRPHSLHYAFHSHVGREVIRSVSGLNRSQFSKRERARPTSTDMAVTKTSGKQEVLSWINRYLEMERAEAISENHPAVRTALEWIKAQYARGREGLISYDEMLSLMMILRSIPGLEMGKWDDQSPEEDTDELIDVVITKTSGKLGVLWWINRYLELESKQPVSEGHSAVEAISKWVEAQYAEGRDEPISDEEMLTQLMTHLRRGVK